MSSRNEHPGPEGAAKEEEVPHDTRSHMNTHAHAIINIAQGGEELGQNQVEIKIKLLSTVY